MKKIHTDVEKLPLVPLIQKTAQMIRSFLKDKNQKIEKSRLREKIPTTSLGISNITEQFARFLRKRAIRKHPTMQRKKKS